MNIKEYRTAFGEWAYNNHTRIRRGLQDEGLGLSVRWSNLLGRYEVSITCPEHAVSFDFFNGAMVWSDDGSERAKTIRRCIELEEYLVQEFENETGKN